MKQPVPVGKIVSLALQSMPLFLLATPAFACDCISVPVPYILGETNAQRFKRQVQAEMESANVVVAGRFISVKGVTGLFKSRTPNGRFEVRKVLKGNVAPVITIYTDNGNNCSAPWIFEKARDRSDDIVISVQPHKSANRTTYQISLCDISYYPADLEKPPFNPGAKNP